MSQDLHSLYVSLSPGPDLCSPHSRPTHVSKQYHRLVVTACTPPSSRPPLLSESTALNFLPHVLHSLRTTSPLQGTLSTHCHQCDPPLRASSPLQVTTPPQFLIPVLLLTQDPPVLIHTQDLRCFPSPYITHLLTFVCTVLSFF